MILLLPTFLLALLCLKFIEFRPELLYLFVCLPDLTRLLLELSFKLLLFCYLVVLLFGYFALKLLDLLFGSVQLSLQRQKLVSFQEVGRDTLALLRNIARAIYQFLLLN